MVIRILPLALLTMYFLLALTQPSGPSGGQGSGPGSGSGSGPGNPPSSNSTNSTSAIYIKADNPFCTEFNGTTCTACSFDEGYYLYGNQCFRFQNRDTDYSTKTPKKTLLRVCDPQCESTSCIEGNSTDKGLCTGCKYNSPEYAFFGYQTPSGPEFAGKYERCVTDCDYFGGFYGQVSGAKGMCSSCPSDCEVCDSSSLCIECSYGKQRYTGVNSSSFSQEVFTGNQTPQACSSRGNRTSGTTSQTYYVTPQERSCTLQTCQGTESDPFDDINLVFQHLQDVLLIGQKEVISITIYLMKVQSNGSTLDHTWKERNISPHYKRVFERTAADVSIQPLTCSSTVTKSCYGDSEKASVVLKSNKIMFFVTKTFTFKNIIVDASELIPDSTCYTENKETTTRCCQSNDGTFPTKTTTTLSNGGDNDAQCGPMLSSQGSLRVPWETANATTDLWRKGPYAFFVMNFLRDYPKYIPTLTIEGCVFKNFWYHRYAYSFIYLDQRGSKLNITDSKFQNFYFPMGLITNMQKLTQRNSFFTPDTVSTRLYDCKTYNSSLSECHSLTLQGSTFQDTFFGDYTFSSTDSTIYANEGIVLSLQEFGGSITIKNNIFKQLASLKFSLKDIEGVNEDASSICSSPRVAFGENYRLSLDRYAQMTIGNENWAKTPRTSSVLSLRNVTQGLTLYNNTFTNNAAETGTGLLVHNFENTETLPIVVEKNTFTGNFASEFGTALAIVKYERDYVKLACKGVYMSDNTFEDNLGCPYTRGTAIISCLPDKPGVSIMKHLYINPLLPELPAYMMGYFVSTNDISNFPKEDTEGKMNRYADIEPDEIDTLTKEIFSKFVTDITKYKDTVNATTHPIYGTTIDTNRVTSIKNTFTNNYAYHSHLFIQGAYNTLVQENNFTENSVPIPQFVPSYLTTDITLFKKALSSVVNWLATESTPLIIRMSNYIVIKDSTFSNNTQLLSDSLSLVFGASITIDKHLGLANAIMANCTFSKHQGWVTPNLFDLLSFTGSKAATKMKSALAIGFQGALVTYNYWDYMYGVSIYDRMNIPTDATGYYETKKGKPYLIFDTCTFSDNIFDIDSKSEVAWASDTQTAFVRTFSGQEGISSTDQLTEDSSLNSYGTYVQELNLNYTNCVFKSNIIKDARSFINPSGFNNLILKDSMFESNSILYDNNSTSYSLCTFLYGYNWLRSTIGFTVQNVTFTKNAGKLMYFEDGLGMDQTQSPVKYKVVLQNINITDHISSPDFLMHFLQKQYTTISNISAFNISANYGFIYINVPRSSFNMTSISVEGMNTHSVGCLYLSLTDPTQSDIVFSDFNCKNVVITPFTLTRVQDSQADVQRYIVYTLDGLPVSGCFAFDDASSLSYPRLTCTNPLVKGFGSVNIADNGLQKTKTVCLFSQNVTDITLADFDCNHGTTKSIISSREKVYLAYFEDMTSLTMTTPNIGGNNVEMPVMIKGGEAIITGGRFINNTGRDTGSVLSAQSGCVMTLTNAQFLNNTCQDCQGAIYFSTGTLTIADSSFMNGSANSSAAVYATLSTVSITNTTFKYNWNSTIAMEICETTIKNCTFEENFALAGQATAYFYEGEVTLEDTGFIKNRAIRVPRSVQVLDADNLSIKNCQFIDYENSSLLLIKGSQLYVRDTPGLIEDSTFLNGRANTGGAVYLTMKEKSDLIFRNCNFTNCYASSQGEAIYAYGSTESSVTVEDSTFSCGTPYALRENRRDLYAVYCSQLACKFKDSVFSPVNVDTGNQLYLNKGSGHVLEGVNFTSDCKTIGNCNRNQTSALKMQEVDSIAVTNSLFEGWGDYNNSGNLITGISSGGAISMEYPETRAGSKQITYSFTNCKWSKNQGKSGGAIYAEGIMNITINGADFENNNATIDGGAIYWNSTSSNSSFIVTGTGSFKDNHAKNNGGACLFMGRKIEFPSSSSYTFSGNTATYGNDMASYPTFLKLLQNPDPSLYSTYVSRKKEEFNIGRLLFDNLEPLTSPIMSASGEYFEPPMVLAIYDEFGQQPITNTESYVTVSGVDEYNNTVRIDGNPFQAENGYVILYPLRVYSNPGSTVKFDFSLTSFSPAKLGRSNDVLTNPYPIPDQEIYLRECIKGERWADDETCSPCESSKYTLLVNSTDQCKDCPIGGTCLGLDKFGPAANYFKLSYPTNMVVACDNDEACLGAVLNVEDDGRYYCAEKSEGDPSFCYTGWCQVGYIGHLCGDCKDGFAYSSTGSKKCVQCDDNPSYYLYSIGIALAGIIYMVIMIRTAIREDKGKIQSKETLTTEGAENLIKQSKINHASPGTLVFADEDNVQNTGRPGSNPTTGSLALSPESIIVTVRANSKGDNDGLDLVSSYLKIFTDYLQIISILGTFNFSWPDQLTDMFGSSEKVYQSSTEIFSFDCMLRQPAFRDLGLNSFFSKLLLMALSPIMFGIVIYFVWHLVFFIRYRFAMRSYRRRLLTNITISMVVCLYVLHPKIAELSIESFKCKQLGDNSNETYLEGDLEVKCWDSEHMKWALTVGLPSMIVWGFGIPIAGFCLLSCYKSVLHERSIRSKFGFLYKGYLPRYYYWDFIVFYRKMILILISVFMTNYSENLQGALVLGISAFNYILIMQVNPYRHETLNEMEKRSLIASTITIYGGLFYITDQLAFPVKVLFLIAIFLGNAYFWLYFIAELLRAQAESLMKIKIVNKLFGCCLKHFINFQWENLFKKKKRPTIVTEQMFSPRIEIDEKPIESKKSFIIEDDLPVRPSKKSNTLKLERKFPESPYQRLETFKRSTSLDNREIHTCPSQPVSGLNKLLKLNSKKSTNKSVEFSPRQEEGEVNLIEKEEKMESILRDNEIETIQEEQESPRDLLHSTKYFLEYYGSRNTLDKRKDSDLLDMPGNPKENDNEEEKEEKTEENEGNEEDEQEDKEEIDDNDDKEEEKSQENNEHGEGEEGEENEEKELKILIFEMDPSEVEEDKSALFKDIVDLDFDEKAVVGSVTQDDLEKRLSFLSK